jgi:hypothetical protein
MVPEEFDEQFPLRSKKLGRLVHGGGYHFSFLPKVQHSRTGLRRPVAGGSRFSGMRVELTVVFSAVGRVGATKGTLKASQPSTCTLWQVVAGIVFERLFIAILRFLLHAPAKLHVEQ